MPAKAARAKAWLAFAVSALLLWKPTFIAIFPYLAAFAYTTDMTTVFLSSGCIGSSTQTVFVFCLLEVLVACVLLNGWSIPYAFGQERYDKFDALKKRKLVGFVIKIVVRVSCALQILFLVAPQFSLQGGLFPEFNMKAANERLVKKKEVTTCADAGVSLPVAVAMKAWIFSRDDMMAVMVWELAFIPELPVDAWLHHVFVILGVALGSDPQILGSREQIQPLIDGVGFFLVLGAALAAAVELPVLMYHWTAPRYEKQAIWMTVSVCVQMTLVVSFFVVFPCVLVLLHTGSFGGALSIGVVSLLAFLAAVEVKMMFVKLAIIKNTKRKAASRNSACGVFPAVAARTEERVSLVGGSFSHNLANETQSAPDAETGHRPLHPTLGPPSTELTETD